MKLDAGSLKDDDGDSFLKDVLLKTEVAVAGQKYIKRTLLGQREQLAIRDPAPSHLGNGGEVMPSQSAP